MKIKIIVLYAALLASVLILNLAEPIAAAPAGNLIDHGTKYTTSDAKCIWNTYENGNSIEIVKSYYYKENGKWVFDYQYTVTLEKVSSTKISITQEDAWGSSVRYENTKLNTDEYYWNIYRPDWLEN
jgi:hypothetical protein